MNTEATKNLIEALEGLNGEYGVGRQAIIDLVYAVGQDPKNFKHLLDDAIVEASVPDEDGSDYARLSEEIYKS